MKIGRRRAYIKVVVKVGTFWDTYTVWICL